MSSLSPTSTADRVPDGLPDLIASLHATLQGALGLAGCPASAGFASAFAEDSVGRPLNAPGGVWAVERESADGSRKVLCLHNPSAEAVSVNLDALLPENPGRQLHFVRGAMRTTQESDGLHAHLAAFGHVWLAVERRGGAERA